MKHFYIQETLLSSITAFTPFQLLRLHPLSASPLKPSITLLLHFNHCIHHISTTPCPVLQSLNLFNFNQVMFPPFPFFNQYIFHLLPHFFHFTHYISPFTQFLTSQPLHFPISFSLTTPFPPF